ELHLATGLEISSEMMAPPKPMMAAKASSIGRLRPFAVRKRLTPSRLVTMPSTTTTARLVMTNRRMRFIARKLRRVEDVHPCAADVVAIAAYQGAAGSAGAVVVVGSARRAGRNTRESS